MPSDTPKQRVRGLLEEGKEIGPKPESDYSTHLTGSIYESALYDWVGRGRLWEIRASESRPDIALLAEIADLAEKLDAANDPYELGDLLAAQRALLARYNGGDR